MDTMMFPEETVKKIKKYCLFKKSDIVFFTKIHFISRQDKGIHIGRTALLARAVTRKIGLKRSAKAAFFGGLIYGNAEGRVIPYYFLERCDRNEVINFITKLSKEYSDGNMFIANCICLDHFLKEKSYGLTRKDFSCSDIYARKLLKITKIIGKIIEICDETERLISEGKEKSQIIKNLEKKFFGENKTIRIATEEAEKLFNKK